MSCQNATGGNWDQMCTYKAGHDACQVSRSEYNLRLPLIKSTDEESTADVLNSDGCLSIGSGWLLYTQLTIVTKYLFICL